ncbi:MAG: hypothetical protein FJZ79_03450 [Chlorobi bacterium]|nr:hypothetical protein [Chlorobiota bacterium]
MESMNPPDGLLKTVAGVAGAAVVGPLVAPFMPVLAGLAVAGLGIFAAGSIIGQVADSVMHKERQEEGDIEDRLPFNG